MPCFEGCGVSEQKGNRVLDVLTFIEEFEW